MVLSKHGIHSDESLRTPSSSAQSTPVHAGRDLMHMEKKSRVWQLQRADEDTWWSKRTAKIHRTVRAHSGARIEPNFLSLEKRVLRGRRCVLLSKVQDPHYRRRARHERRLSLQVAKKLTTSTDKERFEVCWDPRTPGEIPSYAR